MELLTRSNPKAMKGEEYGYLTAVMHLSPAELSGYNVCPMASEGCRTACLNTAGHGGMTQIGETTNPVQQARLRRTLWFFDDRPTFMEQLRHEIHLHIQHAETLGLIPVVRLNATSDLRWEIYGLTVGGIDYPNIMSVFPNIQFYDYTKIPNRRISHIPNYHLTFSRKETDTENDVASIIEGGMNVTVVFGRGKPKIKIVKSIEERLAERDRRRRLAALRPDKPKKLYKPRKIDLSWVPETYAGFPTFHGDKSDLRFLDPAGVVVALLAKGDAKYDDTGFVVWVPRKGGKKND